jgi:hypothetical protein
MACEKSPPPAAPQWLSLPNDELRHLLRRFRLMFLPRVSIAKNHVDLEMTEHCGQRDKINPCLSRPTRFVGFQNDTDLGNVVKET